MSYIRNKINFKDLEILYNKVIGGTSDNILHLGIHVSLSKCCHSSIENLKTHWECTKCRNKDVVIDKFTRTPKPNEMEFINLVIS